MTTSPRRPLANPASKAMRANQARVRQALVSRTQADWAVENQPLTNQAPASANPTHASRLRTRPAHARAGLDRPPPNRAVVVRNTRDPHPSRAPRASPAANAQKFPLPFAAKFCHMCLGMNAMRGYGHAWVKAPSNYERLSPSCPKY